MELLWVETTSQIQFYFITHSLLLIISLLLYVWVNHNFLSRTFPITPALMGALPAVYFEARHT